MEPEPALKQYILKHSLPQICQALLASACLVCPNDPIGFLKNKLMAFQGHCNIDIDWYKFVNDAEHSLPTRDMLPSYLFEKAFCYYRTNLTNYCFRRWKRYIAQRKTASMELTLKMDVAKEHFERKCQCLALVRWRNWLRFRRRTQAAAVEKLESVVHAVRCKRVILAWGFAAKDSKRTREYFEKVENGFVEMADKGRRIGEGCDGLSMLPGKLALKIFQYLELRDWLHCTEVCCTWNTIISQSGSLWSQVNFSKQKTWITDSTVKEILQKYRPFIIHLNLRGCTSLTWHSLMFISECRNLQELNVSECSNVTDVMVQRVVEGCPNLLYLNLSCTPVTNEALRALSSHGLNLQYLSLAYCYRFTDKGLKYLTTGKGCHNLIHLNLSGCTQMTVDAFRYISAGCPSLKDIVINDMATLSDRCVSTLITNCRSLSALSLLDTPHLSDTAFKTIAEVAKLRTFSTEGNNRITDASWKALCRSSPGLRRLHAAECPRMTDTSLKAVASLKNLLYLNISHCNKVSDAGMRYLTEGSSAVKLRELNISRCGQISNISVMRIAQRLSKLHHLNLSYCESLTDGCLEWLSGSSVSSLDISGCNLQDQGLATLEGIQLKKLVLSKCVYITDSGVQKFCKRIRCLEHLDMSHCVSLSDQAVKALSFYCRSLVTLRMPGCPKMTDMAVQYLTAGAHYLRELDVSGCVLLTDRTLRLLERCCPPLGIITMAYCSGISKLAALKLQPRVQYWEHSRDDPPYWFGYNNKGQMLKPIKRPSKSDSTWEEPAPCGDKTRS